MSLMLDIVYFPFCVKNSALNHHKRNLFALSNILLGAHSISPEAGTLKSGLNGETAKHLMEQHQLLTNVTRKIRPAHRRRRKRAPENLLPLDFLLLNCFMLLAFIAIIFYRAFKPGARPSTDAAFLLPKQWTPHCRINWRIRRETMFYVAATPQSTVLKSCPVVQWIGAWLVSFVLPEIGVFSLLECYLFAELSRRNCHLSVRSSSIIFIFDP